ncbi:MAG: hypothetical protein FWH55_00990, partial [Oscillospiraceae bacterium]|nr:hypothetical protein [Oscillospiraceae bacterium]
MKRFGLRNLIIVVAVTLLAVCCINSMEFISSQANSEIDTRKQQQKDVNNQLGDVRQNKTEAISEEEDLEGYMTALQNIKQQSEMTYSELVDLLESYNQEILSYSIAIDDAEELFDEQEELLKYRIRHMYMNSNTSLLDILIDSPDLVSFMEKIELYSVISKYDRELMEDYKNARLDLQFKRSIQLSYARNTQGRVDDTERELEGLEGDRVALELEIAKAKEDIDKLEMLEDELEKESKRLEQEIRDLTAKAEAEAAAKAAA